MIIFVDWAGDSLTLEHISCSAVAMALAGALQRNTWHFSTQLSLSPATKAKSLKRPHTHTHTVDWLMGNWSCVQQVKQKMTLTYKRRVWGWVCVCGSACEHVKGREFYLSLPGWRGKRGRVKEKERDSVSANRQREEMKGEVEFNMLKGRRLA